MSGGDLYYQHSCQSRVSGVYLVVEVFQETELKEMLAISYLVLQACILFLRFFGPPTSQSCSRERTLSCALWKMSRIFREISCDHFPCKSKDEIQYLSLHSNLKHGWFTRKFANHI